MCGDHPRDFPHLLINADLDRVADRLLPGV
jgi:hypothetical protein